LIVIYSLKLPQPSLYARQLKSVVLTAYHDLIVEPPAKNDAHKALRNSTGVRMQGQNLVATADGKVDAKREPSLDQVGLAVEAGAN